MWNFRGGKQQVGVINELFVAPKIRIKMFSEADYVSKITTIHLSFIRNLVVGVSRLNVSLTFVIVGLIICQ